MSDTPTHFEAMRHIMSAAHPPLPWQESGQLPWHDQAFSERMLAVHLDPDTHMASRAPEVINRHLDWLLAQMNQRGQQGPTHVLDVGCGPGLYCHELARRGHRATGFDYAPAPLAWAQEKAEGENLNNTFFTADLTDLPVDLAAKTGQVDAITFWFGEFHSFQPEVAENFLSRLLECLRPGGLFVLEYQPWDIFVKEDSNEWSACEESVFCNRPHLWLQEFSWNEEARTEVHVHWIIEQESGNLHRYEQCHQGWPEDELVQMLERVGLVDPAFSPPITGVAEEFEFPMLVTRKKA